MTKMRQCWTFCRGCYQEPEEDSNDKPDRIKDKDDHGRPDAKETRPSDSGGKTEEGQDCPGQPGQDCPGQPDQDCSGQPVLKWLQSVFGAMSDKVDKYEPMFTREGYTDTSFIAGMTDKDLKDIGVTDPHDRHDFRRHIKKLHQDEPDIEIEVPDKKETWLGEIGLATEEYKNKFEQAFPENTYPKAQDVFKELKAMTETHIMNKLGVNKKGHLRRLKLAITRIREPTQREVRIIKAKRDIEGKFESHAGVDNTAQTKKPYLDPTTEQFRLDQIKEEEFKQNLLQLRNYYLAMFFVANSLWLVLMFALVPHAELQVLNTNPLGLVFLVTFILVLGIQFAALFFHRLETLIEWVSRIKMRRKRSRPTRRQRSPAMPRQRSPATAGGNSNITYDALPEVV